MPDERGVSVVPTPAGDFQLLPRSLLITPFGEVLDLQAIRAELAADVDRDRRTDDTRRMTMDRHPFDPISAALGVVTIVVGVLVMTDAIDLVDGDGGWWFAVAALVVGLGLIPWRPQPATGAGRGGRRRAEPGGAPPVP